MSYGLRPYGTQQYGLLDNASTDVTVALTGAFMTASAGTLIPSTAVAANGAAATSAAGTLVPSMTTALTGIAATSASGTVTAGSAVSVALTGPAATISAGNLAPSASVTLAGIEAVGSIGTLTASGGDAVAAVTPTGGSGRPSRKRHTETTDLGNRTHGHRRNSRQGVAEEEMAETLAAIRPGAQFRTIPGDDENDDEEAILWLIH